MKISLILAHPDKSSFNHAIAAVAAATIEQNNHELSFHDLYEKGFDPLLPAEEIPKETNLPPRIEKHCAYEFANNRAVMLSWYNDHKDM